MKTIKRTRQVRFDELLKYVWNNGITRTRFEGKDCSIYVDSDGDIDVDEVKYISKDNLFTIEEEIEITEETKLDLVDIYKDYGLPLEVAFCKNTSVKEILKLDKESKIDTRFIHLQNEDGSIGDLIWRKREVD